MNQIEVKLLINTYEYDPSDWIIDAICDQLKKGESLASIRCMAVKPVYVKDILFNSRMDALAYCESAGISPAEIKTELSNRKDE